jgi:photosystem II stability/assembly factor-like uncharacterized protein
VFDTFIGTRTGIHLLREDGLEPLGLARERVSAVHAWRAGDATTILAGTYGEGLHRSTDAGQSWSPVDAGLTASAFRCLGPDPSRPGALLAGTEPARLFRSEDGGATWRELDAIARLDGHDRWFLPYSPRAGALRNVHGPAGRPERLLASVEVGGLLRSEDRGRSWACEPVIADEDIHHVTGPPDDGDLVYASLGTAAVSPAGDEPRRLGGIARSRDGGATWEKIETDYTRATIVPPARPDLLLAGPALRVGRGGRIVASADGGDTWEPASDGIEVPMPDMVELFAAAPDGGLWAICSRGRLLRADGGSLTWRSALPPGTALDVESIAFA